MNKLFRPKVTFRIFYSFAKKCTSIYFIFVAIKYNSKCSIAKPVTAPELSEQSEQLNILDPRKIAIFCIIDMLFRCVVDPQHTALCY